MVWEKTTGMVQKKSFLFSGETGEGINNLMFMDKDTQIFQNVFPVTDISVFPLASTGAKHLNVFPSSSTARKLRQCGFFGTPTEAPKSRPDKGRNSSYMQRHQKGWMKRNEYKTFAIPSLAICITNIWINLVTWRWEKANRNRQTACSIVTSFSPSLGHFLTLRYFQ